MDDYTEISEEGWLSRLTGSIKSVGIGLLLFLGAFAVLFWNEGRTVKMARDLAEGKGLVETVKADQVSSANEGKLVHMTGPATVATKVRDKEFKIKREALRLVRNVEMYQWKETKTTKEEKKLGGKKVKITTYSYSKEWSSSPVDSSKFNHKYARKWGREHNTVVSNPAMGIKSKGPFNNESAKLGSFRIPPAMLNGLTNWQAVEVKDEKLEKIGNITGMSASRSEDKIYLGENPSSPRVGDYRISIQEIVPQDVSLVAKQVSDTFEPFTGSSGNKIQMLSAGVHSAESMFQQAEESNKLMVWILRLVGFLMMAIGLYMIFSPVVVVADVVPFIGSILSYGIGAFAGVFAAFFSLITIAIAWLFYRPLIAIPMIVIAVGAVVGLKILASKKKTESGAAAT